MTEKQITIHVRALNRVVAKLSRARSAYWIAQHKADIRNKEARLLQAGVTLVKDHTGQYCCATGTHTTPMVIEPQAPVQVQRQVAQFVWLDNAGFVIPPPDFL
jgi:hypothetical protein